MENPHGRRLHCRETVYLHRQTNSWASALRPHHAASLGALQEIKGDEEPMCYQEECHYHPQFPENTICCSRELDSSSHSALRDGGVCIEPDQ